MPIPAHLREFLAEVSRRIDRGDYEAVTESDDLLQEDGVFGGRNEEGGDVWGFTYYPADDCHPRWELAFSRQDLRRIETGEMTEMTLWFCTTDGCGYAYPGPGYTCRHPGLWRPTSDRFRVPPPVPGDSGEGASGG